LKKVMNGTLEGRRLPACSTGQNMHRFAGELYPVCRSITGNGVRKTLEAIGKRIPVWTTETPSGTHVFDWIVPNEWNVSDAYISDLCGNRLVDFKKSNLHLLNYSTPTRVRLPLAELRQNLFTIPSRPDWIPYRTSYYKEAWGFCLTHNQLLALEDVEYDVVIETSLQPGSLTYGECLIPGRSEEEVLISCHVCHPSLANDNLSGIAVATFLAEFLLTQELAYSYRFVFIPGTIGAITWLARNSETVSRIRHGLVLAGLGDRGGFHYKKSRRGDAFIDRATIHALRHAGEPSEVLEFSPYGYDERQYCSPGFNLPVGCLMRSVWGTFPEYHTSADDLNFITSGQLQRSLDVCTTVVDIIEHDRVYSSNNSFCEPQLGRRGLYQQTGGTVVEDEISARLWALNFSDGQHSLLDIAERSGLPFSAIRNAADLLHQNGLLSVVTSN